MALERMRNCGSVSALAEDLGAHRTVLYHSLPDFRWRLSSFTRPTRLKRLSHFSAIYSHERLQRLVSAVSGSGKLLEIRECQYSNPWGAAIFSSRNPRREVGASAPGVSARDLPAGRAKSFCDIVGFARGASSNRYCSIAPQPEAIRQPASSRTAAILPK